MFIPSQYKELHSIFFLQGSWSAFKHLYLPSFALHIYNGLEIFVTQAFSSQ